MQLSLSEWQEKFRAQMRGEAAPTDEELAELFLPASDLPSRFSVYRHGYHTRTTDSLLHDFLLTKRLLGEMRFLALAGEFLKGPRFEELELNEVSPHFADFLLENYPSSGLSLAVKVDLAGLEARYSPEREGSGNLWGWHPSVRQAGDPKRAYLLWREKDGVKRERVQAAELAILQCFREPASMAAIGDRLQKLACDAATVQETVAVWSEAGVICAH